MFDADKAVQATEADVIEWYKTKAELQKLQARERALRDKIIKSYFPAPSEGTNKVEITGGVMKMTHKIDRKIDLPSLAGTCHQRLIAIWLNTQLNNHHSFFVHTSIPLILLF